MKPGYYDVVVRGTQQTCDADGGPLGPEEPWSETWLGARAVRAEFARRVAARNPGRALPDRLRIDARPMRPVLVGAGCALAAVVLGAVLPWEHFVTVALALVGVGAVLWRPLS